MSSSYRTVGVPSGLVTEVDPREARRLANDTRVCGMCTHFCHAEGQKRFGEGHRTLINSIVKDHGWKLHYLGSHPKDLGICGEYESGANASSGKGSMITGRMHSAEHCASFRPTSGAIGGGR